GRNRLARKCSLLLSLDVTSEFRWRGGDSTGAACEMQYVARERPGGAWSAPLAREGAEVGDVVVHEADDVGDLRREAGGLHNADAAVPHLLAGRLLHDLAADARRDGLELVVELAALAVELDRGPVHRDEVPLLRHVEVDHAREAPVERRGLALLHDDRV